MNTMTMQENSNKTILKNTVFLYARTLILLVLGLYTSRVTMQALGVENYGIINVVSGFVAMFSLISGALTGACQRFITFELGKPDGKVRQIFSSTFYIHVILAVIIVFLAETVGLYFVNSKLNLPPDKMDEVQWVFQCSVISFALNLINIPYNALIIAHEKMKAFAYISLVEAFLKFVTVYAILILSYNALILYSVLTLVSSTLVRFVYQLYCVRSFNEEAKVENVRDKQVFKEIFKFAGWSFIGNTAFILNGQGVNIILNLFCGVVVNAARGIATTIENTLVGFINSFTTSLNPQITKSYALKDTVRLQNLLDLGIRASYALCIIFILPLVFSMEMVLKYWLEEYPQEASTFSIIVLFNALLQAISNPLMTAVSATGRIRNYQLVVGGINLLNLPLAYLLLSLDFNPCSVFICALIINCILFLVRLYYVKQLARIDVNKCIESVLLKILPALIVSCIICYMVVSYVVVTNLGILLIRLFLSFLFVTVFTILFVTSKTEKNMVFRYVVDKIKKI